MSGRAGTAPAAGRVPPLHVVTDDAVLARPGFREMAAGVLAAGGREVALHVRGPRTGGRALLETAAALTHTAAETGALLVVNDRLDVALAAGAGGVHLGVRSLPVEVARPLAAGLRVGVSTHADAEVAEAVRAGADWVFMGMIYASPTHPGREGRGPDAVASAVRAVGRARVPVIAIGGITPGRVPELREAGAHGVAVLRGVWDAPDPSEAVSRYMEALAAPRTRAGGESVEVR